MANKIKPARGTKTKIESVKGTLEDYEIVYSTNTKELGVKNSDGTVTYFSEVTNAEKTTWNNKQNKLTAGSGITISGDTISATGGGVEPIKSGSFQTGIPIGDYSKYSVVVVSFSFSGFLWSYTTPLPDTVNGTKESYVTLIDAGFPTPIKVTLTTSGLLHPDYVILTVSLNGGAMFSSAVII